MKNIYRTPTNQKEKNRQPLKNEQNDWDRSFTKEKRAVGQKTWPVST